MNLIKYFILILVITNLFFLVGCDSSDESDLEGQGGEDIQPESEDTGISDVFEDSEEVNPPEIPV